MSQSGERFPPRTLQFQRLSSKPHPASGFWVRIEQARCSLLGKFGTHFCGFALWCIRMVRTLLRNLACQELWATLQAPESGCLTLNWRPLPDNPGFMRKMRTNKRWIHWCELSVEYITEMESGGLRLPKRWERRWSAIGRYHKLWSQKRAFSLSSN